MASKRTEQSQADAPQSADAAVLPDMLSANPKQAQNGQEASLPNIESAQEKIAADTENAAKETAAKPAAPKTARKKRTSASPKPGAKKTENPKETFASPEQEKTLSDGRGANDALTTQKALAQAQEAAKQTAQASKKSSAELNTTASIATPETPAKKAARKKRTSPAKPKASSAAAPHKEPQKEKTAVQDAAKNNGASLSALQEASSPEAAPEQKKIVPAPLATPEAGEAQSTSPGKDKKAQTFAASPESAQKVDSESAQEAPSETTQKVAQKTLPEKAEGERDKSEKEPIHEDALPVPAQTQETKSEHPIIPEPEQAPEKDQPAQQSDLTEKPRRKRHYTLSVFAAMTGLVAAGSVLFVYLLFTISNSALLRSRPDVDLPNFYGMTQEQVEDNREYDRFDIEFVPVYTNEANEGIIFSQTPKPPKQVKDNAHIVLRVSQGVRKVEIPTVTGLMREEAEALLKEKGVSVLIQPEVDETQEEGVVLRSEPVAGTVIKAGDTVTLHISRALVEQTSVVPDCVGKDRKEAQTLLQNLKLSISVKEVLSTSPDGTVVSQSPKAGTVRQRGSAVTLEVASSTALDTNGGDHEHKFITKHIEPGPVSIGGDAHICEICGAVQWSNVLMPTG